jgi:hypothetical protein
MEDIERRAVFSKGSFDGYDSHFHSGAKASRLSQHYFFDGHGWASVF